MTMIISGSDGVTFPDSTTQNTTDRYGFVNRIINGDMRIDQRNAGASVTPSVSPATVTLDRWKFQVSQESKLTTQQNAGSVSLPTGFSNYLGVTSSSSYSVVSSDYFVLQQYIEGFNFADMAWGTASAKTVTLSFQVYSSLTGTFGGSLYNSAGNRSYPFTYAVSAANTWTNVSITIPGDTTGTWIGSTNGIGVVVTFSLGSGATYSGTAGAWAGSLYFSATGATSVVGTNGATWYITGVQLEAGSVATPFERRPFGTELSLCQRYYETWLNDSGTSSIFILQFGASVFRGNWVFKTQKRASATVSLGSGSSWGGATPTIYGGISGARFDTTTGAFATGAADTISLQASAEL